jgi:hypothetical protein
MDLVVPWIPLAIPVACAGIAVVSTVFYFVLKWKELKVLREIRDKLAQK